MLKCCNSSIVSSGGFSFHPQFET